MSFSIEIDLPDGSICTFNSFSHATTDELKDHIFYHVQSLKNREKTHFIFLDTQTKKSIEIEFTRFLANGEFENNAKENKTIKIELIEKSKLPARKIDRQDSKGRISSYQVYCDSEKTNNIDKVVNISEQSELPPTSWKFVKESRTSFQSRSNYQFFGNIRGSMQISLNQTTGNNGYYFPESTPQLSSPNREGGNRKREIFIIDDLVNYNSSSDDAYDEIGGDETEITEINIIEEFKNENRSLATSAPQPHLTTSKEPSITIELTISDTESPRSQLSSKSSPLALQEKKKEKRNWVPFTKFGLQSPKTPTFGILRSSKPNEPPMDPVARTPSSRRFKGFRLNSVSQSSPTASVIDQFPIKKPSSAGSSRTESDLIESGQFGFHIDGGDETIESYSPSYFNIEVPEQVNYYELFFSKNHSNYIGTVPKLGPVIISCAVEKDVIRALIRTSEKSELITLTAPNAWLKTSRLKYVVTKLDPNYGITYKHLRKIKNSNLSLNLRKFDESHLVFRYKFGILYCKEGQTTEEQWFGNEHGSPEFNEFVESLGERITLQGWKGYRGGLDCKDNSTGQESIFTTYDGKDIMFHVSTFLPFSAADEQKIERKRHLGNDIVVIIYKEGNTKFPTAVCKSVFNHVYIVVQKNTEDPDYYDIGVTIKDGVKNFGPVFPPKIHKSLIRQFLLVKMLNGEWAAYRSLDFAHKFKRTRKQQLTNILNEYDNV